MPSYQETCMGGLLQLQELDGDVSHDVSPLVLSGGDAQPHTSWDMGMCGGLGCTGYHTRAEVGCHAQMPRREGLLDPARFAGHAKVSVGLQL